MSNNIIAYYKNSFVELYPDSEVFVVPIGMAADLANNIRNKAIYLTSDLIKETNENINDTRNKFNWSPNMSNSDMEHIISMFNNSSQLTIFSPLSDEKSTEATPEKDPNNTPVSSNESPKVEQVRPAVIIVTKKVNVRILYLLYLVELI